MRGETSLCSRQVANTAARNRAVQRGAEQGQKGHVAAAGGTGSGAYPAAVGETDKASGLVPLHRTEDASSWILPLLEDCGSTATTPQ